MERDSVATGLSRVEIAVYGAELLKTRFSKRVFNGDINPILVPPFFGSDKNTIDQHGEVKMISASHTGGAGQTDDGRFGNLVIGRHIDLTEMGIKTEDPLPVIDHHHFTIDAEIVSEDDDALLGGFNIGVSC